MTRADPSGADGKRLAAGKALEWAREGMVVGVGTGTTVAHFIAGLAARRIAGAVSSSEASSVALRAHGIAVLELADVPALPLYVDGADECNPHGDLIKGGGGALTREKILADAAATFVCIVDPAKRVDVLGAFPLPIEVIPMARVHVARALAALTGGTPVWRAGYVTDNGNHVLDVRGLRIVDPVALEAQLDRLPGIVTVGLYARRRPDVVVVGTDPPRVQYLG